MTFISKDWEDEDEDEDEGDEETAENFCVPELKKRNFYTPEYLDLTVQFLKNKEEGKPLRIKRSWVSASQYVAFLGCPYKLDISADILKLVHPPHPEDLAARQASMKYGKGIHDLRVAGQCKEEPNSKDVTTDLSRTAVATKRLVQIAVGAEVREKLKSIPTEKVTPQLREDIETEIVKQTPKIDRETKEIYLKVIKTETFLVTKDRSSAKELDLVYQYKGIWISARLDGIYLKCGQIDYVDEFKTSNKNTYLNQYVNQAELYCLMLRNATGNTSFPFTLSLGVNGRKGSKSISADWDKGRVLDNLDKIVDYLNTPQEIPIPTPVHSNCKTCSNNQLFSKCPKAEGVQELSRQIGWKENQENQKLWKLQQVEIDRLIQEGLSRPKAERLIRQGVLR